MRAVTERTETTGRAGAGGSVADRNRLQVPTLKPLQEWEGYVVEIGDDEFVARLVDLTAGHSHETAEATIPLEELSEADAAGMTEGSVFRWVIGYEDSPAGTRKRISQIVFLEAPVLTESDVAEASVWAERMAAALRE